MAPFGDEVNAEGARAIRADVGAHAEAAKAALASAR
jgi:hypothetical protein